MAHLFTGLALALVMAAPLPPGHLGPQQDIVDQVPPKTTPDLIFHPVDTDHTASRLDCEVFGWNQDFTEVAAMSTTVNRGMAGKHRGEADLLVYTVGEMVPMHNIVVHTITHADLPHDPVPLEDARDNMWTIEESFLNMWPRRPKHTAPLGAMKVEPIWQPVPSGNNLCTPEVGFLLTYRGRHQFQPFKAIDMTVSCAHLSQTDRRIYWGRKDVAAAMMRFDFSPRPSNEKSARFVVSAAWRLSRPLQTEIVAAAPLTAAHQRTLSALLQRFGRMRISGQGVGPADGEVVAVAAKADVSTLGAYVARMFRVARADVLPDSAAVDLQVTVSHHHAAGSHPSVAAAPAAPMQPPSLEGQPLNAAPTATATVSAPALPRSPSSSARYLRSWHLP